MLGDLLTFAPDQAFIFQAKYFCGYRCVINIYRCDSHSCNWSNNFDQFDSSQIRQYSNSDSFTSESIIQFVHGIKNQCQARGKASSISSAIFGISTNSEACFRSKPQTNRLFWCRFLDYTNYPRPIYLASNLILEG